MKNPVIVPVRNALSYTKDCLHDLWKQDVGNIHVIVINNGSTDGTAEWLRWEQIWHPDTLTVLSFDEKHGVAASWNLGLMTAFSHGAEWALVTNNDVRLRPETYSALLNANLPFATGVGVGEREKFEERWTRADREHPDFSCYLIRYECWQTVGRFDESFAGAYGEDADYHLRMHLAGISAYCIGIPFLHYACGTLKSNKGQAGAISTQADCNREYFRRKWECEIGSEEYYARFTSSPSSVQVPLSHS